MRLRVLVLCLHYGRATSQIGWKCCCRTPKLACSPDAQKAVSGTSVVCKGRAGSQAAAVESLAPRGAAAEPLAPQELRALAWGQDHMRPTPKGKLLKPKNVSGNDMMVAVPWAPGLAAPPLSPAARPFVLVCPLTPEGTVAAICWSVPRP